MANLARRRPWRPWRPWRAVGRRSGSGRQKDIQNRPVAAPGMPCQAWRGSPGSNDTEQLCGDGEDERGLEAEDPSQFGAQGADLSVEVGLRLLA